MWVTFDQISRCILESSLVKCVIGFLFLTTHFLTSEATGHGFGHSINVVWKLKLNLFNNWVCHI